MIKIYNFDNYEESGIKYGGHGGSKKGIIIDNERWFLKYPKPIKRMKEDNISYTTTPISEYLGSCIYDSAGIDTHKTLLGIANGKLVVACKDFLNDNEIIFDYNTIKNDYNEEIENKLLTSFSNDYIEDIMLIMQENNTFKQIPELKTRFWDMFIIDALINNNDRNEGNWGTVYDRKTKELRIAPVFDNGASFYNKSDEEKIDEILNNAFKKEQVFYHSSMSIFKENNKQINPLKYIESMKNKDCNDALIRLFNKISLYKINEIFKTIPTEYNGITILSNAQKSLFFKVLVYRYNKIFLPVYNKLTSNYK